MGGGFDKSSPLFLRGAHLKIIKKLKAKNGEISIDTSIMMIIFVICLAVALTFFAAMSRINTLNTIATEICRYSEIKGRTDGSVTQEIDRIIDAAGFPCNVSFEAQYISGTNKVQLGGEINVIVHSTVYLGAGGIGKIPIEIKSKATGRSERYWK